MFILHLGYAHNARKSDSPLTYLQRTCRHGHRLKPKYYHKLVGGNFRLDAILAAVVSAKLPHRGRWTAARQQNAKRYDQMFHGVAVGLPAVVTDRLSNPSVVAASCHASV